MELLGATAKCTPSDATPHWSAINPIADSLGIPIRLQDADDSMATFSASPSSPSTGFPAPSHPHRAATHRKKIVRLNRPSGVL